ncbi:MAG TPA: hypothetical protein VMH35_22790 [Streptosporangiaceae bacterium]|nr:hypothetical protein [Streptosporangiaceae bacterium]
MTGSDYNSADTRRGGGHVINQLAGTVRRAARAVAATIAECNRAQRRMAELRLSPDRFMLDGGARPPVDYAEFLFRTSGLLAHEPPADRRFAGRGARR